MYPIAEGCWLFIAAWLLAQVEIQIEGAHGWAANLPTWRWDSPAVLRITNGKAVTGYHVYMTAFLLVLLHAPLLFTGWERSVEARLLAFYFLFTIVWDFQWFVWNPAWGVARFRREPVPWFPIKFLGLPLEYYTGVAGSFFAQMLLWPGGLRGWLALAGTALLLTLLSVATAASIRWRPKGRELIS